MAVCVCVNRLRKRLMSLSQNRVCILMNQWFLCIFGIHSFYAKATLLNIWICMQWTDAYDGGFGGGLDFAPMHAIHRCTWPNCNKVAITGISHMSLALLNHWRWIGQYSLTLGYFIQGEHWPRHTKNIQHAFHLMDICLCLWCMQTPRHLNVN